MRLEGYDYLCKPVEREILLHLARVASGQQALTREVDRTRGNLEVVFRSVASGLISIITQMLVSGLNPAAEGFCMFSSSAIGQLFMEPRTKKARLCYNTLAA